MKKRPSVWESPEVMLLHSRGRRPAREHLLRSVSSGRLQWDHQLWAPNTLCHQCRENTVDPIPADDASDQERAGCILLWCLILCRVPSFLCLVDLQSFLNGMGRGVQVALQTDVPIYWTRITVVAAYLQIWGQPENEKKSGISVLIVVFSEILETAFWTSLS